MLSLILSSPQAIMFRKVKHPYTEYHQCTSEMVLEMISELEIKDGELVFHLLGLNLDLIYFVYHFAFLFFAYYLPLFCINKYTPNICHTCPILGLFWQKHRS